MNLTPSQKKAVSIQDKDLLVAAAAGSGKTFVLVKRIIDRLLDPDKVKKYGLDKLMVVTFTDAAAKEMKARIGEALNERIEQSRDSSQSFPLVQQLLLLDSAAISTLHSFCQRIVQQYFYLVGLEPDFRIADELEARLLQREVLEKMLLQFHEVKNPIFLKLTRQYGGQSLDDSKLQELILKIYLQASSHPNPKDWLNILKAMLNCSNYQTIDDTPWSQAIRASVVMKLEEGKQLLAYLRYILAENKVEISETCKKSFLACFIKLEESLNDLIAKAGESWEALREGLSSVEFSKAPAISAKENKPEELKKVLNEKGLAKVKSLIKEQKEKYFSRTDQEYIQEIGSLSKEAAYFIDLLLSFGTEYTTAKSARGIVDYNDLEHYCLAVLQHRQVLEELQRSFSEIMVDEYQDTNEVQETIVQLLSEKANLFMVGDVKQSIYGFRLAEPRLFLEKYCSYSDSEECSQYKIDLSANFRSRKEVLHFINFLFYQLMVAKSQDWSGITYGPGERLIPGAQYAKREEPALEAEVEFYLINSGEIREGEAENQADEDLDGFELESRLIANKIKALKESKAVVYDLKQKSYRSLKWRDMVILLRSVQNKSDVLVKVLRQAGIPAYAEIRNGYLQETEVQIVLSLLQIIDNPQQDIPLAAVLRSKIGGMKAAEMAQLRIECPQGSLWDAILQAQKNQKAAEFLERFFRWKEESSKIPAYELIARIYQETGYYNYVGALPGGVLRQANLRLLIERAQQYQEIINSQSLFSFLQLIERIKEQDSDLGLPSILGDNEDVVRVMTIHGSKGLEFPVVFVADLGKEFNTKDTEEWILSDKNLGLGPYIIDEEAGAYYSSLPRLAIKHKMELERKAEELRLLYVAFTRAKEKLVLVGSVRKLETKLTEWSQALFCKDWELSNCLLAKAKTYLDWIGPALMRYGDENILREKADFGEFNRPLNLGEKEDCEYAAWKMEILSKDHKLLNLEDLPRGEDLFLERLKKREKIGKEDAAQRVTNILGRIYPYSNIVDSPLQYSVTELKQLLNPYQQEKPSKRLKLGKNQFSGVQYGTLMHLVMSQLELAGDLTELGIRIQLDNLVERQILTKQEKEKINLFHIASFFNSDLGQRMCRAKNIWREMPFTFILPPQILPRVKEDLLGEEEVVYTKGIIDCLFEEDDGLIILDYKTDQGESEAIKERYKEQLNIYALAIETILGRKVKGKYLYLFSQGKTILI